MSFQVFHSLPNDAPILKIPALGLELVVLLPPSASGNDLTIIETTNAPCFGPPLHRHPETEVFRVLEGRYLFEVDGKRFEAGAGEVVSVPGGVPHTFLNITGQPAHQFIMILPGMDALRLLLRPRRCLRQRQARPRHPQRLRQALGSRVPRPAPLARQALAIKRRTLHLVSGDAGFAHSHGNRRYLFFRYRAIKLFVDESCDPSGALALSSSPGSS